jgi:hypothetical protein
MKLTHEEREFLSAWAREEWEPACYQLPCHRLLLAHGVSGAQLLVFIKAWKEGEGKKDLDILGAAANAQPRWPWSTTEEFRARLTEASRWRAPQEGIQTSRHQAEMGTSSMAGPNRSLASKANRQSLSGSNWASSAFRPRNQGSAPPPAPRPGDRQAGAAAAALLGRLRPLRPRPLTLRLPGVGQISEPAGPVGRFGNLPHGMGTPAGVSGAGRSAL